MKDLECKTGIKAVFFDLDGVLVDTRSDFASSI